ncbi:phage/plasmid primase, P4 family [Alicyclobacillus acidocaldarius]|uniref:Phage/plasmid primase, P4 family n=1 Tax=Alicyclobacillus acidocaldarius (strain Tc-4-1) TaxID=1048834 RepID=F8IDE3_ALIAT|nr:phage/plasmid primase, P4 family [Alicyclobacillus acidocaldarius]AEJ43796.1 phage/plasmid primase, P4 family [Alicyclobacillus acidocaldarius subsp. acidocaldarius Tc-4-1]
MPEQEVVYGDSRISVEFLKWWFEGVFGYVEIRPIPNRREDEEAARMALRWRRSFQTNRLEDVEDHLRAGYQDAIMARCGWYFGVCPRYKPVKREEDGRWVGGSREDVDCCRGAWADIDDHGDEDDAQRMKHAERALEVLADLGIVPSAVVRSGGGQGKHLYFRFTKSVDASTGVQISRKLARVLGSDPAVADAARVLRIPGSLHTKSGTPILVKIESQNDDRYDPDAFEHALDEAAAAMGIDTSESIDLRTDDSRSTEAWDPVPIDFIRENLPALCPRMALYIAEPNVVTEPVWHKMASLLKSLNPDSVLFHEWSKGYNAGPDKRYRFPETERKFRSSQGKPIRCSTFHALDPLQLCQECPHFAKQTSPATVVRRAYAKAIGQTGIYGMPRSSKEEIRLDGRQVDGITFDRLPSGDPNMKRTVGTDNATQSPGEWTEVEREDDVIVRDPEVFDVLRGLDETKEVVPRDYWRTQGMRFEIAKSWMQHSGNRAVRYDEERDKWELTHWDFAKILYQDFPSYYFYSGINLYNGSYYEFRKGDEEVVKRFIGEALASRNKGWATMGTINHIFSLYKNFLEADEERNVDDAKVVDVFDADPVFPVLNGLLDVSDGHPVLRDFTPDCRVTWKINVEWWPQWAEGPRRWTPAMKQAQEDIDEFLSLYEFTPETLQALLEALGYTLARFDMREQRYFILLGPGYNGKGTFLRILEAMCGKFVQTVTLQELAENRFAAGRLARAAVNIVADASNQTLKDTETIKKLTGNDLLTAEMKYRDAFPFRPRLKLWMAANYLPPTPDTSFGFFRRPLIFPFHKQFPVMNADWEKRLHTKEALSYLFFLAVKYYLKMRLDGRRLTESPEMRRVRLDYWANNDVVQAAIQNGIFEFPTHDRDADQYVVPRALATKAIELFAEELGRKKVSTSTLFERLRSNYGNESSEKVGNFAGSGEPIRNPCGRIPVVEG